MSTGVLHQNAVADPLSLQVGTINTLMGSLLSLFNAIIVTQYFTDLVWVIILVGVTATMAVTIARRLSKQFDLYVVGMTVAISGLFSYALYERSLSTQNQISVQVFWPIAPVVIYVSWVVLLEIILRRKI